MFCTALLLKRLGFRMAVMSDVVHSTVVQSLDIRMAVMSDVHSTAAQTATLRKA